MTPLIKNALLTVFFIFGLLISLQAQDKYQFAVISYRTYGHEIGISINGKEFQKLVVPKEDIKHPSLDVNVVIELVNKMTNEGWEVFSTGNPTVGDWICYVFYLRKKIE